MASPARPVDSARAPDSANAIVAPEQRALTIGLVATVTLVAFQALAIATAMPLVARDLGDLPLYGWTFSAFFLANLVSIVATGRWIDRRGLVEPFVAGIALVAIGLVIAGSASSMGILVLGRAIQGLGAGSVPPIAYVAIGRAYPEAVRPKMFAILSTAWIVPSVLGPAIAGEIAARASWRWIFLGLVPFLLISAVVTVFALRRAPDAQAAPAARAGRPLVDALLIAAGAGLVVGASTAGSVPLGAALVVAGLVVGLPALRRVVPPGTLTAVRGLPATILARGVLTFAFFGADAYVPLALVDVRGTTATFAGLALTGASVTWTAGAWIQAHRIERWGPRRLLVLGQALIVAGIAVTAAVLADAVPPAIALVGWTIAGLGMGLCYSPLAVVVLREAPAEEQGTATAALQLCDVLGVALGTGAGGAILAATSTGPTAQPVALAAIFGLTAAVALAGIALARQLPGRTPAIAATRGFGEQ